MVVGGSCGDNGSAVEVWVLGMGVFICPIVVSSRGTVYSAGGASWDGFVGSDGPSISYLGGDRIPKCWCICLRMAVCWVWMAISWSWCARTTTICWARTLWVAVNVCKVWHKPLKSEINMAIVDSDGWGADVTGTTDGVLGVVRGADDVASGVSTIEGTVGAGAMISIGISTYCGSSGCGISGCSGLAGASGYAI